MQIDSVRVTRDSLSTTEERRAPHERTEKIIAHATIEEIVLGVFRKLKTADPAYSSMTWVVTSQTPIAVIAKQWDKPRVLLRSVRRMQDSLIVQGTTAYLHFCQYKDADPDTLFETMEKLRFPYLRDVKP